MTRAFVAIPVPGDVARALAPLQAACPLGRAVPSENLHLTLAYLGDAGPAALADLDEALAEVPVRPLEITASGLDIVGGAWPSGIALSVAATPELERLQTRVLNAARSAGLALPRRRFRPHITLIRLPKGADSSRLQAYLERHGRTGAHGFGAAGFTLYRSDLKPDGAQYTPLADYGAGRGWENT